MKGIDRVHSTSLVYCYEGRQDTRASPPPPAKTKATSDVMARALWSRVLRPGRRLHCWHPPSYPATAAVLVAIAAVPSSVVSSPQVS